jgi:hypothetical protein
MHRIALAAVTAATLLAAAQTAHADPGDKNPKVALALSIAGTAAGPALVFIGERSDSGGVELAGAGAVVLGPSLGEWYSGKPLTYGMAARAIGGAVMVGGFVVLATAAPIDLRDHPDPPDKTGAALGIGVMAAGAAAIVGGALYDIVDAPKSADDWNTRHHLTVSPTYEHGRGGLALAGTF